MHTKSGEHPLSDSGMLAILGEGQQGRFSVPQCRHIFVDAMH